MNLVEIDVEEIRRRLQPTQDRFGHRASDPKLLGEPGAPHVQVRGDHNLNPDLRPKPPLTPAAVLVPLVVRPDGITVLLTKRTAHLAAHAGQISFPGGRVEDSDIDAMAGALRETEEEIGLTRERIEIIGRLDTYIVRTGFEITPLVGLVMPPFTITRDEFEVAEVFEVPLAFVLDPKNHQRQSRVDFGGAKREFWAMPHGDYFIWGATAGMLVNLYEVLRG
ncbi:MAG TPA: CoA pyrophosphatase [Alphaproteobacteria bacterium]